MGEICEVGIVGGGLAGLAAARALSAAGADFRLFEARDRLGGRILTVGADGLPARDGLDLGPSWFWPGMHAAMARRVADLGLAAFEQHGTGDVVFERSAHEPPRPFPAVRQEPPSMRLIGGTAALVAALADALPPDRLHLRSRLTAATLGDAAVSLTFDGPDGERVVAARHVVLALPPRLLGATVRFDPDLDPATRARWAGTPTWMAPHAKLFARYDRPFWRDAGLSGDAQSHVGPLVEIHDATTASGTAALFGFVGVPAAQRAGIGEPALVRAAIAQLARLFGPDAATPRGTLLKDWAADPLTATSADRVAGEHPAPLPGAWLPGPWAARCRLAGSETSRHHPGYLAGALDAGERAARELLERLESGEPR